MASEPTETTEVEKDDPEMMDADALEAADEDEDEDEDEDADEDENEDEDEDDKEDPEVKTKSAKNGKRTEKKVAKAKIKTKSVKEKKQQQPKKKAKKVAAADAEPAKPKKRRARSSPLVLNDKESNVLQVLKSAGKAMKIREIAEVAFPQRGTLSRTKGSSWTRNSLRRLLKNGFISHRGKGEYQWEKSKES